MPYCPSLAESYLLHSEPVAPVSTVVADNQPDEPPFIEDLQPENVCILRGRGFTLTGKFVGWPMPEVTWQRGRRVLKSGRTTFLCIHTTFLCIHTILMMKCYGAIGCLRQRQVGLLSWVVIHFDNNIQHGQWMFKKHGLLSCVFIHFKFLLYFTI